MKMLLDQDPSYRETEVIIHCAQADGDALRLVAWRIGGSEPQEPFNVHSLFTAP